MADVEGIKSFLYSWLQQNFRKSPEYTFLQRPAGRGRIRFICQCRVDSFEYVGVGNSANKKDAQTNSARDFISFLVREGCLKESQVPAVSSVEYNSEDVKMPQVELFDSFAPSTSTLPMMSQSGFKRAHDEDEDKPRPGDTYINRIFDQKKLEEAEEVDFTADIHGGWSMENAKARLNEYLQSTRQPVGQIKYTAIGPDHSRSFLAESRVFAKKMNKELYARETGSNKAMASRACCLSLVRQLFHANEIDRFTGVRHKKKSDEVPATEVEIDPDVEQRLDSLLEALHLVPNLDPPVPTIEGGDEHNMITNYKLADFEAQDKQSAQTISWCPPTPNWNPWTSCNIDEGPESTMTMRQISSSLTAEYNQKLDSPKYVAAQKERAALPVHAYRHSVMDIINANQITLIKGETGCGKTTQIPQFILDSYMESGRGADCSILVTQPRRICAISLAERMASERCEPVGTSVGYSVRFETVLPRAYGSILFCTVGTLCRKMEAGLRGVSHIIIDEIHERDVNTDFMLILIRDMVKVNKALRVVLMSATIDTTTFTDYFENTAMVELEGRMHPVTHYFLEDCVQMINYTPPPRDEVKWKKKKKTQEETMADVEENCNLLCSSEYPPHVARSLAEMPEKEIPFTLIAGLLDYICAMNIEGAVLIFLPGWNTISMLRKFLQTHPHYSSSGFQVLPLHSQVPREDQRLVFRPAPSGVRKIVLSTNIAESSITINDVVFVIDACLARVKVFTARNNMTSYSTVWASCTNLEQRRGRAGRVRAGFAFHLCSRARFDRLEQHSTPEILRTPLHELALMIKLLRLGEIPAFLKKAVQPPPLDAVIEAEYTLKEMKALDSNDELTPLGQILAHLPLEPRLGRMLVFASAFNLGGAMSLLAAQSSSGCDAFLIPPDRRRLSYEQLRFAAGTNSDHLATLNVFQVWSAEREGNGPEAANYLCDIKQLNGQSLRVIEDAASQIRNILIGLEFPEIVLSDRPLNFSSGGVAPEHDYVAAMLTIGLYPNIAYHSEKRKLLTAEGKCALVHKISVNCIKNTSFTFPLFTFSEKIRTQAVSCKMLTMISPIHILLFGCRKSVWRPDFPGKETGVVILDDWIPFRMHYSSAVRILALRPALEALLVRICLRPGLLEELSTEDAELIEVTKAICCQGAYRGKLGQRYRNAIANTRPHRFNADYRRPLLQSRNRRVGPEMDTSTFSRYEVNRSSRVMDRSHFQPNYIESCPQRHANFNPGGYQGGGFHYQQPQYGYSNQYQQEGSSTEYEYSNSYQQQGALQQSGYPDQYQRQSQQPPEQGWYQGAAGDAYQFNGAYPPNNKYTRGY